MMTSHSEGKRPYALVPQRVWLDRDMSNSDLRVLGAMCCYVNRAGVCWPGVKTLAADTGIDPGNISKIIKKLVDAKYVRRLEPNDYDQKAGAWGMSNRYQVLWVGNEPVPTYEQLQNANLFQLESDQLTTNEGSGARDLANTTPAAHRTAAAIAAAIERATGSRPVIADLATCTRLADTAPATIEQAVRLVVQRTGRVPSVRDVWQTVQTLAAG